MKMHVLSSLHKRSFILLLMSILSHFFTAQAASLWQETMYQQAARLVHQMNELTTPLTQDNYDEVEKKNKALGRILLQDVQAKQDFIQSYRKFAKQLVDFRKERSQQNIQDAQQRIQAHLSSIASLEKQLAAEQQKQDKRLESFFNFTQQFHKEVVNVVQGNANFSQEIQTHYIRQIQWGKTHQHPKIQSIAQQLETLYTLSQKH